MDYRPAVLLYTALSLGGLVWRVRVAVQGAAGVLGKAPLSLEPGDGADVLNVLLQSRLTIALIVNLAANAFLLIALFTKVVFFGNLTAQELHKLAERLVQYVLFKLLFLSLVEISDVDGPLWLLCFTLVGYLKAYHHYVGRGMKQWRKQTRIFSAITIALETCQTLVHYAVHLGEAWHQLQDGSNNDSAESQTGAGPSTWEWRGSFLYHTNLILEVSNLLLMLCHFVHVWYLHGINPQLLDALLFLNIRTLLLKLRRRLQGYLHYRAATRSLHQTFPDATPEQLHEFDDCCAICKDPMSVAKKLPCSHLFHLSCLRSWLDHGAADNYSCPTCRTPFVCLGRGNRSRAAPILEPPDPDRLQRDRVDDTGQAQEHRAAGGQAQAGHSRDEANPGANAGASAESGEGAADETAVVRGGAFLPGRDESGLVQRRPQQGGPGEEGETTLPLESNRNTGAQNGAEEVSAALISQRRQSGGWFSQMTSPSGVFEARNWWPLGRGSLGAAGSDGHLEVGTPRRHTDGSVAVESGSSMLPLFGESNNELLRMAETVQEVLPHLPPAVIMQDLRRTGSAHVTLNRLLEVGL
ncbi:hypothetical protein CBR_g4830 [Chara braunii]|uniref:RING-type domain-containing protein n=1 Tax=Chara braunii TaxID=69332 RepID=A0A388KJ56_CHABU|nr:hypothetical protein CBR_g4830 [Chara braunii]|eukprot:GBG70003.1 hypothetical protein CBR_g4830 [Chara braunii]